MRRSTRRASPQCWAKSSCRRIGSAAIVDGADRIIARTRKQEEFVGKLATPDLRQNATGLRGLWIGSTAEGLPVLGAYARSAIADWRIAVGVPVAVIEQPLYRSIAWLLGMGATALIASALLAGFFAQKLAAPLRALAVQAERLGRGETVQPTASAIAEVSNVSGALEQASTELRQREAERQQAEAELRSSRARLERVLDTSPVGIVEINRRGEFLYVNTTAEQILRSGAAELEGRRYQDMPWVLKSPDGETLSANAIAWRSSLCRRAGDRNRTRNIHPGRQPQRHAVGQRRPADRKRAGAERPDRV